MIDRDRLVDALFETDLISGYDWLGTSSIYPSEEEIEDQVREMADQIMQYFAANPPV